MTTAALPPQTAAQQILAELAADPALAAEFWKLIADQQVKALPQTVAELDRYLRETLSQVAAQQQQTEKALAALTLKQEETRVLLDQFINEQRRLNAEFREEMAEFRQEMKTAYDRQEILNAEFRQDIKAIKDSLNRLNGPDAERHAENNIGNLLRRHDKNLRDIKILKSNHRGSDPETNDAIADAYCEDRLTPEEYEQVSALDLLIQARPRQQTEPGYYAIEISRTLNEDELTRARDRAALLTKALGWTVQPLVIGSFIAEHDRWQAAKMRIPCIIYSRLKS